MSLGRWADLVLLSLLWGGAFFLMKVAGSEAPPFTVVLSRVAIAALALAVVASAALAALPREPRLWVAFIVLGALTNTIPFALITWAQQSIPTGVAAIINASTPLFTVLLAHWTTADERLTAARVAGVACGMAGVGVLIGPRAAAGFGVDGLATLAVAVAAFCYAVAAIGNRRLPRMPATTMAFGQLFGALFTVAPLSFAFDRPWTLELSGTTLAAMAALGVFCTALAYFLYLRIIQQAGATNGTMVTQVVPLSAATLGWLFLDETLGPEAFLAFALIATGFALVDGRVLRRFSRSG